MIVLSTIFFSFEFLTFGTQCQLDPTYCGQADVVYFPLPGATNFTTLVPFTNDKNEN